METNPYRTWLNSAGILAFRQRDLSTVPEEIRELAPLIRGLVLQGNRNLRQLPPWIGELTSLTYLNLYYTGITRLPEALLGLNLSRISIGFNENVRVPKWLGQMKSLASVGLQDMGLTKFPELLRELPLLRDLYLGDNRIQSIPDWLHELQNLRELYLNDNRLSSLPNSLYKHPSLRTLNVRGNDTLGLPTEILRSTEDPQKILNYYFRAVGFGASQPLNEFKLVLVGRGLVGKTSLVHRLVTGKFKEFKRTPGIAITKWPTRIDDEEVRAHIWDFGGQEIMHGTHRFFMTERALYVVLVSGREGTEDHDAEYWLSLVRSFGGEDVPVIILLHKWDDYQFELARELLRSKYGKNLVFIETDSHSGRGMNQLREQIRHLARTLPGLKAAWPAAWRQVKEELPAQRRSWLTFEDFRSFCADRGVPNASDQEILADSLHDLGLMLSYRRDEMLRQFGVLNPQWVTKGIYEMLNSGALKEAGGKFTVRSFAEILPPRTYPVALHPYLLALMRKFRLCHPLDDKGTTFLIPELLTKEGPKLDKEFPPKECLGFVYSYNVMLPEGLLPRFIVETYVLREPKLVWRTGVVLERGNARALVRGDVQGRRIDIRVAGTGNGRRELLGIIREHFERIHRSYEHLPVTELVPIPGYENSHVKYELLLKHERGGRDTIAVEAGDELVDLSVEQLLDGVDLPGVSRNVQSWDYGAAGEPVRVFISYAHEDAVLLDQLRTALVVYERTGELAIWADALIAPGDKWERGIMENLQRADIVMLLLSNDFLASYYCMDVELAHAVKRHAAGTTVIVPIVVRACRFDKLPIGEIQVIQPQGMAVSDHDKPDRAWLEVTKALDHVIARVRAARAR